MGDAAVVHGPATSDGRERYRDALRVREFRFLFAASVVSVLGDVVAAVALTVLIYRRTGSTFAAALAFTVAFAPHVLGGALLGSLADRVPPRRLLVSLDVAAAVLVGAMALPGMPTAGQLGLLGLTGLLAPVAAGAGSAILPDIVPDAFVPARSLFGIMAQGSQVLGNATAGGLLIAFSPRQALVFDAATFLVSAGLIGFGTRRRPPRGGAERSVLGGSLRGARATLATPDLRRILCFLWFVPMFAVAPEALAAAYVERVHAPAAAVGLYLAAIPAGVIASQVLNVSRLSPTRQIGLVRPLAAFVFAPLLLFALQPPLPAALVLLVLCGLAGSWGLGLDRLLLGAAPVERRGAIFGLSSAGLMSLQGLGFAAAGAVGEVVSPAWTIALAGVAGLVTVAALRLPAPALLPVVSGV
jgi:MFS family permease